MTKLISKRSLATLIAASLFSWTTVTAIASTSSVQATWKPLSEVAENTTDWPSFSDADQVYNDVIKQGIDIEDHVAKLKADTSGSDIQQASRLYLASLLQWRHGKRWGALTSVREALKLGRYGELLRQEGRLLDAVGRTKEAVTSYREAIPLLSGEARLQVELRLALLIASDSDDIAPLLSLAERSDAAVDNQIAIMLAVLGHPGEAARLYTLLPEASDKEQQHYYLRLTEWALQDRDVLKAQQTAWQTVKLAKTDQDRLYALALLTESHRLDDSLPQLIEKLAAQEEQAEDTRALWVSLLREIDRPNDALAALTGRAEKEPRSVKRQFIGLYRESGKTADMVAELKRLMAVDPNETIWPHGLAEFYLENNDRQAARAVWQGFIDRCGASRALLYGAAEMKKLNFDELALDAAEKAQRDAASIKHAALFRFELYLERGRHDEARQVLEDLDNTSSPANPVRKTIAMSYERLKMPKQALRVMTVFANSGAEQDVAARQYLAHLLVSAGEPEKAIDNLIASLADAAPAQRRLIQTRVIAAARAADREDQLKAQLTEKLHSGSATESEAQLLIEMRIRANEEQEALSLIDTLYSKPGADQVEKLQHLAALHRSLSNWRAYDGVLVQLVKEDADNAVLHVRGRIINYLENLRPKKTAGGMTITLTVEGQQPLTLESLLKQYSEVSGAGADREFQAGILAIARRHQQALDMFREIVAVDPTRVDSYQAIGNQLVAMKQKAQAITLYQYLVESSRREDVAWASQDSIVNQQPSQATLQWAKRRVLERLSADPGKFDYYRQLADIAADLGNRQLQLAALQNGLSAQPELRMSTLRELLSLTGATAQLEAAAAGNQKWKIALNQRHINYGRRLLALGLAMPPDVYIGLGRAMMAAGHNKAALQAVTQAVEDTGRGELLMEAATIFQQANDDLAAQILFEKALVNDPTNIGLMLGAAESNERLAKNNRAAEVFLDGLTTLLQRQPLEAEELVVVKGASQTAQSVDEKQLEGLLLSEGREIFDDSSYAALGSTHSWEYRQYYLALRNGLVRTLALDRQQRDATLERLWGNYRATLAEVTARKAKRPRLVHYPRLNLQTHLLRYLGYTFGDYAAVNAMDETLLKQFAGDPQLPEIVASHRMEWGGIGYLQWLERSTVLTDAQKAQLEKHWTARDNPAEGDLLAVRTGVWKIASGRSSNAPRETLPPAQQALQNDLDAAIRSGDSAAVVEAVKRLVETDLIWVTLEEVENTLSAAEKKTIARHVIAILRRDRKRAEESILHVGSIKSNFNLKTKRSNWAAKLEDWSGDRALDDKQLLDFTREDTEDRIDPWFVYRSLSVANRKKWLKQRVINSNGWVMIPLVHVGPPGVPGTENLIAMLLQQELDQAEIELLTTTVEEHVGLEQLRLIRKLITVDIHPSNVSLARELLAITAKKYSKYKEEVETHTPDPLLEPNLLRCQGRVDDALNSLVDIFLNGELLSPSGDRDAMAFVDSYQQQLVAGNEARLIDILSNATALSPEQTRTRNHWLTQLRLTVNRSDPEKLLSIVLDGLRTDPENVAFLQLAETLYSEVGEKFAAYQMMLQRLENLPNDPRDGLANRERVQQLEKLLAMALELDNPVDALAYHEFVGQLPPTQSAILAMMKKDMPGGQDVLFDALAADDHIGLKREMTRLWQIVEVSERRRVANSPPGADIDTVFNMQLNLDDLEKHIDAVMKGQLHGGALPEEIKMLPVVARHPLGVEMMEQWLSSLRGRLFGRIEPLSAALADAHVYKGTAGARFDELTAAVREQRVGDKELSLWLSIGSRVPELAARPEAGDLLADYMQSESAYRPWMLTAMAGFLSARGDHDSALRCFRSLIYWARNRNDLSPLRFRGSFSLNAILAVASDTLDEQTYRILLREQLDRIKPWKQHLVDSYSEFVLKQFENASDQNAFYQTFKADVDEALANFIAGSEGPKSARRIRTALIQFKLGRQLAALDSLKLAMEAKAEEGIRRAERNRYSGRLGLIREPVSENVNTGPSEQRLEIQQYRNHLGIGSGWQTIHLLQVYIFPGAAYPGLIFADAQLPWLKTADSRIRDWIEAGEIDSNTAASMLLSLCHAYHSAGAEADMNRLFAYLKTRLAGRHDITAKTVAAMFISAERLGQSLDQPQREKQLLLKGIIEPEYMAAVLNKVAHYEGDAEALKVGAAVLEFTLQDKFLDELIRLAESSGQPDRAQQWRALQKRAHVARKQLKEIQSETAL